MRFSLLQYKRQSIASWSLLLVCIVLFVCFSQNLGLSKTCPLSSQPDNIEQIHTVNSNQVQNDDASQCSSSEQLVNAHTIHLDFAIPMFILALLIIAAILKQAGSTYFFTENMFSGSYDSFLSRKPSKVAIETIGFRSFILSFLAALKAK